jgi:DNA-binding transcriptional LysR family regulator
MRFAILQNEVVMQFDPRDLEDLIALSQAGSLSAAAKRRGVAISTISRRIEALETALKIKLVDRQARGSRLTRAGSEIAKAAEPLSAQLGRVNQLADAIRSDAAMMPVRLSATEFVISDILSPALGKLWSMGAGFPLHLQSQSDIVSLAGRDADLAVRMSRPEGASLFIRKLPTLHLGLFAAEGYLDGRHPARLDLGAEKLLIYDDSYGRLPELEWLNSLGLRAAVAMRTGSTRGLLTACLSGAGIALLPKAIARREPSLVEVDAGSTPAPRTPWLIVHRDLRDQPSIRLVQKWVVQSFEALGRA